MLYLYVASTTHTIQQVRWILVVFMIAALVEGFVFAILAVVRHSIIFPGLDARVDPSSVTGIRIGGTVGSPNGAGSFFAMCTVIALTLLFGTRERSLRRLACVVLATGLVCLVLTFSRGAWLAFVVASIFVFASLLRAKARSIILPLLGVLFVLGVLAVSSDSIRNRLFTSDPTAAASRVPLMELAVDMIVSHPVLGVGANNYPVVLPRYARFGFAGDWFYTVHNKYLLVWAETGTFALIAFVTFAWSSVLRAWRVWKRGDKRFKVYGLAICGALVTLSIHMCFDVFRGRASIQMLWLLAALALALEAMDSLRPAVRAVSSARREVPA
jgi:O-antigen ligase